MALGETLLLYTDGITEARNPSGVEYGRDALSASLLSEAISPRKNWSGHASMILRHLPRTLSFPTTEHFWLFGAHESCCVAHVLVAPRSPVEGEPDQTAKVWDALSGQELLTLRGHTNVVNGVAYSRRQALGHRQ